VNIKEIEGKFFVLVLRLPVMGPRDKGKRPEKYCWSSVLSYIEIQFYMQEFVIKFLRRNTIAKIKEK
jgi:hypothetical protein